MLGLFRIPKPGELVQVAGYVFIQGTTHPLQLFLDQGPDAFDGIGVCVGQRVDRLSADALPDASVGSDS